MSVLKPLISRARLRQRWRVISVVGCMVVAGSGAVLWFGVGVSRLEVVVMPAAVREQADIQVVAGPGLVYNSHVWALQGRLMLQVVAPGYAAQTVELGRETRLRRRVDIILDALPATLQALAEPRLEETAWMLDGRLVAQGPSFVSEVPAGGHRLSARHPYYVPASRMLDLERGASYTVTLHLVPVAGKLELSSTPSAAVVMLSDRVAGVTPLELELEGGEHELVLVLEGYEMLADTLVLTHAERMHKRHYTLVRAHAKVSFDLSPAEGALTINGQTASQTEAIALAAGVAHQARYMLQGYVPGALEFTLQPGAHRRLALVLTPIHGIVEVYAEPEADIEVNGKYSGRTPQRLRLPAAAQEVRLSLAGYQSVTRTLTPVPDTPQRIQVTLRPEGEVRRLTAPMQYTNSAGIALQLFKGPGTVTLGSARGTRGRRANEFMRKVRLTRSFYAGVHEVTVGQYRRFTHSGTDSENQYPVTGIRWEDAARYCNWLSRVEGLAPVYHFKNDAHIGGDAAADGYRLLTEAEWEWLARKVMRADQTLFPWGDDVVVPPRSGNLADESARGQVPVYISGYNDGFAQLAEVGGFNTNPAGLHDLAGNVREWTHDVYELRPPQTDQEQLNPLDMRPGKRHTVKGSSWRSGTLTELRAAWRGSGDAPEDDLGFRVARYLVGG